MLISGLSRVQQMFFMGVIKKVLSKKKIWQTFSIEKLKLTDKTGSDGKNNNLDRFYIV